MDNQVRERLLFTGWLRRGTDDRPELMVEIIDIVDDRAGKPVAITVEYERHDLLGSMGKRKRPRLIISQDHPFPGFTQLAAEDVRERKIEFERLWPNFEKIKEACTNAYYSAYLDVDR
jgi:hypothetical protein